MTKKLILILLKLHLPANELLLVTENTQSLVIAIIQMTAVKGQITCHPNKATVTLTSVWIYAVAISMTIILRRAIWDITREAWPAIIAITIIKVYTASISCKSMKLNVTTQDTIGGKQNPSQ